MSQGSVIQDQRAASSAATLNFVRYLWCLTFLPVLFYLLPLCLIRTPAFERLLGSKYGPALDYGFQAVGINAEIVIFGDSSALYGISPRAMSAQLGMKVVNLPNTLGGLPVTGDMALQRYLASNKAPRLIIFMFTPWNLSYSYKPGRPLMFEGEEMLARHGTSREIWAFAKNNRSSVLQFPLQVYASSPRATLLAILRRQDRMAEVTGTLGQIQYREAVAHLNEACVFPAAFVASNRFDSVRELLTKYVTPSRDTLAFIAPIPGCRNAAVFAERSYAELNAAPPRVMDPGFFMDDHQYAHVDSRGAVIGTAQLIAAVRSALDSRLRKD